MFHPASDCGPGRYATGLYVAIIAAAASAASCTASEAPPGPASSLPAFDQIQSAVERHFASLDYYRPGDLISRSDAADALKYVADLGWAIPDRAALEGRILSENDFLVQKLRTKEGMKFMSQIGSLPGGYDRLDRLSAISGGRKLIHTLISDRGGADLIEYLSTTKGGANLGRTLAGTKNGSNLNKPTGRIYTVDDLIQALAKLYEDERTK